jgi:hypothetical protein
VFTLYKTALSNCYRFYILVAGCVVAQKTKFLRNVCLAAALIFPAISAIHAIALAAFHVDGESCPLDFIIPVDVALGAVDMDVYGAFQMCSLGMLAAPITIKFSKTYFNDPARNTIFLWAGLILAGEQPYWLYKSLTLTF